MSKETKDVVLGIHNYYREKVGQGDGQYPAADMQIMVSSSSLMTNIVTRSEILLYYYYQLEYLEEQIYLKMYNKHY